MPSEIAKKVAGTYIHDSAPSGASVVEWLTGQCRTGQFKEIVEKFCREQEEIIDPALVVVESVTGEDVRCKIPFCASDHESSHTFQTEVRFGLNPVTGKCARQMPA